MTASPVRAVSVVVPTFNRATALRRLLAALERCASPEGGFEVVVVDDGSSDGTAEVVRQSPLDVNYVHQQNLGPAAARNAGWRIASAPIIAFTDDDCVPEPNWLIELVAPLRADPVVHGVGGGILPLVDGVLARFVQAERLVDHGWSDEEVRYLITANAAFRRASLAAVGGFDESFKAPAGEDVDLSLRIRELGGVLVSVPSAVIRHDHRTSIAALLRTSFRHGRARTTLALRHEELRVRSAVDSSLRWSSWRSMFHRYRASERPPMALGFCALHLVRSATFVGGILWERAPRRA